MTNIKLVNSYASLPEADFFMAQPPMMLGRSLEAEVRLEDPWVSRRHCRIDQINGAVIVRDLGSMNGVYIDDRRVEKAIIPPSGLVRIGAVSLRAGCTEDEAVDNPTVGEAFDVDATRPMRSISLDDLPDDPTFDID